MYPGVSPSINSRWWLLLFLLLPLGGTAQVFVRANATGANDGSSWANAYTDLKQALDATSAGEVWVAAGTYRPVNCNPCSETEKALFFNLPPEVQLYGGFNGTETAREQRDPETQTTILSGDIGVLGDSTDNVYKVILADNSTTNTVLDGFIIEEGNADGSFGFSAGGGLYLNANPSGTADIQVRNCTFRNNYAGGGGGVVIDCVLGGSSAAVFSNCLFEGNTASLRISSTGAAVLVLGNSGAQIRSRFVDCIFRNNFCGNDGGAFSATPSGAGSLLAFEIEGCTFESNRADDRGGAVWYRMTSEGESRVKINNCQFFDNSSGGQGGAVFARSSFSNIANDTLANCYFRGNTADGSSTVNDGQGGAVFLRGSQEGIRNHQIINCVFERNSAQLNGGAIGTTSFFSSSGTLNASVLNCTFFGNQAATAGGAIHVDGSQGQHNLAIANSILWRDTATGQPNEITQIGGTIFIAHSNLEGGLPASVTDGGNNQSRDPEFADPAAGDLHLLACSPLIDQGDDNLVFPIGSRDLDGDPRPFGAAVDLGAYERTIHYVDQRASGANSGRSWTDAFREVRDGLQQAQAGDALWVAQGTYLPVDCTDCTEEEKRMAFQLPSGLEVFGGFRGAEIQLEERDWTVFPTILSGDIGLPGDSTDNSISVVIAENVNDKTILDGFIIEEGNADGSFGSSAGGGLYIDANPSGIADLQVRHCTIRNNYAGGGGGVAIDCVLGGSSKALFEDCLFEGNTASLRISSTGAGVFVLGNSGAQINTRFLRCTFRNNYCGNDGGAISATPSGEGSLLAFQIDSCHFEGNRADDRGGAIWYRMTSNGVSRVVIKNSTFLSNQSGGEGGALFARSSFDNIASDSLLNCRFTQNRADGSSRVNDGQGGAVFLRGSQAGSRTHTIANCIFDQNFATLNGGALGTTSFFSSGGVLEAAVVNCTFFENRTDGDGGAIFVDGSEGSSNLQLQNSVLWNNIAEGTGDALATSGGQVQVSFSDVEGGLPPVVEDGGNNLNEDPQFLDPGSGDFRISSCSPLRNAGDNTALPTDWVDLDADTNQSEPLPIDWAGNERVFDDQVDIGALEWVGAPPLLEISFETENPSCANAADGIASVNLSGGVPEYNIQWSTGATTATIGQLESGNYMVTVTDAGSCELVDSVRIEAPEALQLSASQSEAVVCPGTNVQLMAMATGGQGNITFNWNNGLDSAPNQEVSPSETTTYLISATDQNGCRLDTSLTVTVRPSSVLSITGSNTFCIGGSTLLEATPGFAVYQWADGSTEATRTINTAGDYALTATDTNGCTASAGLTVTESVALEPIIAGPAGLCLDASADLSVGTFTTYEWSTGAITPEITVSVPGSYSVTVTDASGCIGSSSLELAVLPTPEITLAGSSTFCAGSTTVIEVNPGFVVYQWSDGVLGQSREFNQAGTLELTVTDTNGCSANTQLTITESATLQPNITGRTSLCGEEATNLDAGIFNNYQWSTGAETQQITVTAPGIYGVTVSDGNGCSGTDSVLVALFKAPTVDISGATSICPGTSVTFDAGPDFAQYAWSDGSTAQTLTVTRAGTYAVTVTAGNGCTAVAERELSASDILAPTIEGVRNLCAGETTVLDAGTFDSYRWSTGATTPTITVGESGTYRVTVGSDNGCSVTATVNVVVDPLPEIAFSGPESLCGDGTGTLEALNGPGTYQWSTGSTVASIEISSIGTYELTFTDLNGCTNSAAWEVGEAAQIPADAGVDQRVCPSFAVLMGNQPPGTTGRWTTAAAVLIDEPNAPSTEVSGLSAGAIPFIWTLSAVGCPDYSSDTLVIDVRELPEAVNDFLLVESNGERSVTIDLLENDQLPDSGALLINLISPPSFGTVNSFEDGILHYEAPGSEAGGGILIYELCALECPDLCSEAAVAIRVEAPDERLVNGITPNGDGVNDTFVFDQLLQGSPEDFPDNRLLIFNRWGDIVFEQEPYDNNWSGTNQNGDLLPEGTYYYIMYLNISEQEIIRGDVTIVR